MRNRKLSVHKGLIAGIIGCLGLGISALGGGNGYLLQGPTHLKFVVIREVPMKLLFPPIDPIVTDPEDEADSSEENSDQSETSKAGTSVEPVKRISTSTRSTSTLFGAGFGSPVDQQSPGSHGPAVPGPNETPEPENSPLDEGIGFAETGSAVSGMNVGVLVEFFPKKRSPKQKPLSRQGLPELQGRSVPPPIVIPDAGN